MPRGRYGVHTGTWIRDLLIANGEVSPYQAWLALKQAFPDKKIGNAHTVMTMFWLLESKLKLIERTGTQPSRNGRIYQLYKIRPRMERSRKWNNIYKNSYPKLYQ